MVFLTVDTGSSLLQQAGWRESALSAGLLRLGEQADILEGCTSIQNDLDRLENGQRRTLWCSRANKNSKSGEDNIHQDVLGAAKKGLCREEPADPSG